MSLPLGGVFDVLDNWTMPHQTHRDGDDADINRPFVNGTRLGCSMDMDLRQAVDMVLVPLPPIQSA